MVQYIILTLERSMVGWLWGIPKDVCFDNIILYERNESIDFFYHMSEF